MKYKFFKVKNGVSSFATVDIELCSGTDEEVLWSENLTQYAILYGDAVCKGVRDALQWHLDLGGATTAFKIIDFVEMPVDTKADAARCAATIAAWLALGHDQKTVQFVFDGEWRAIKE